MYARSIPRNERMIHRFGNLISTSVQPHFMLELYRYASLRGNREARS